MTNSDSDSDAIRQIESKSAGKFELTVDGEVAELTYRLQGDRFVIDHTGVPSPIKGRGIGSRLVRAAVEHTLQTGKTVVPLCPFARHWMDVHHDEVESIHRADNSNG